MGAIFNLSGINQVGSRLLPALVLLTPCRGGKAVTRLPAQQLYSRSNPDSGF